MINEPKEKATIRAYLTLLIGCSVYPTRGLQAEKLMRESEARPILCKLVELGCTVYEETPKEYKSLKYKGDPVAVYSNGIVTLFQLRGHDD